MSKRVVAALSCVMLGIAAQTARLRISVNLAQIDAKVTDSKGNPVPGLTADDFELQIDGKTQKITHCDYIPGTASQDRSAPKNPTISAPAGVVPSAPVRPEDIRRTMVIFVDDLSQAAESIPAVRAGVRKVIERDVQPGDLTAIIRASAGLGALQDFTTDKEQLLAAADQIRWNPRGGSGAAAYHAVGIDAKRDEGERGHDLERTRGETFAVAVADSLRRVIRGMGQLPGRKALVLLSDYMPMGAGEVMEITPTLTFDFRNVVLSSVRGVVDQAARSGVVIYAVDTRGLNSLNMTAADRYDPYALSVGMHAGTKLELNPIWDRTAPRRNEYERGQLGSEYLARETGGFMLYEANDIGHAIERAYADLDGYYELAFTPAEEIFERTRMGGAEYRRIGLRVRKPDLRIRYRTGFYGVPDEEGTSGPPPGELGLNSAFDSPLRAAGIPMDLDCAVLTAAKDHAFLHVLLRIDPRKLPLEGPLINRSAIVHLLVRAYGVSGAEMEGGIDQRLRVSLNEEGYDRAMKNGLVYATTITVSKPGPYVVRAALLDEAREERGTANQFILVPNVAKGRLALSGLLSASSFATKDNVTPAARPRTVAPGEHVSFAFEVLNAAPKDALRIRMQLFRDGQPVWESAEGPLEVRAKSVAGKVLARADLPVPAGTPTGEYLLQVEVSDSSKKAVAAQWARVEVR